MKATALAVDPMRVITAVADSMRVTRLTADD